MDKIFFILVFLFTVSCAQNSWRGPAAEEVGSKDLQSVLEDLNKAVTQNVNSSEQCYNGLKSYYQKFFNMTSNDVAWDQLTEANLKNLIKTSFNTRLVIKEKLKALTLSSEMDHLCLGAVKNTFRALRYVEDYLIEISEFRHAGEKQKEYLNLSGQEPYFLVNKNFNFKGVKDLKSGDVILSRGNAYSSAAIARIGRNDMQFSHLSFVYKDDNGKFWTSEAHIEIGSVVAPIKKHIDQGNSRSVVFRYKDEKLAHEASKRIFERVQKRQEKEDNIKYDFGMDYLDDSKIFCSEIIYAGFKEASNGEVNVPLYKTKFNKGLVNFLSILGIKISSENYEVFDTFAPGDIQFDPDFELVTEWRNPSKMKDSRLKDMILTKMFDWMENKNYQLDATFSMGIGAKASWLLRRTPFIKSYLKEKFPTNMTTAQLKLFIVLDKVGESLKKKISEKMKEKKRPMSPVEMFQVLDDFRVEDYEMWVKRKQLLKERAKYNRGPRNRKIVPSRIRKGLRKNKPIFHKLFHPVI